LSGLRWSLTKSHMSSIVILPLELRDIISLLSISSIVEVGGGDGVKFDQLIFFCLFFPSVWAVKATSRRHKLCADFSRLMWASVSLACWYSLYTDGPPMEALENSCGTAHLWGFWMALSVVMHCTKGCCSSLLVSGQLRCCGCASGITAPQPVMVMKARGAAMKVLLASCKVSLGFIFFIIVGLFSLMLFDFSATAVTMCMRFLI